MLKWMPQLKGRSLMRMTSFTDDEMLAIRWHMTAWDLPFQSPEQKGNLNTARDICPLCSLVQSADTLASNIIERKEENLS